MLSIDFIRQNKEKVAEAAKNKNREVNVEKILQLDEELRAINYEIQKLREERNTLAKSEMTEEKKERGRAIKDEIKTREEKAKVLEIDLHNLVSHVPNVPLDEVPVGKNEDDNFEIKKWGELPTFDFTPKSHTELGLALDLFDLERGTKVSGFRGYFLKNQGALLHIALLNYVFMRLVQKGYIPLIAPSIVKGFTLFGSGQFPWGEQEVYKLNDEDAYLAGTAEVPVTAYFANETLHEKDLPKKFVAFSPCFRREAGSYGKDTKGLYRLHEFWKIEQVIVAKNDLESAKKHHSELQKNTEEIWEELGMPYRVMLMCTGDMGEPQIFKYDTEVWMPSRGSYGEVASNSILGDFQAQRLNIKYRDKDNATHFCYTLNNTAIPSPRALVALLENNQQKDGSITIPKVLQPLCGFGKISPKNV